MKIGDLELQLVKKPARLDERLRESTGCSAAETRHQLRSTPIAGSIAAALLPFVAKTGAPHRHELATAIAAEGVDVVRPQVLALYEGVLGADAAADAPGEDGGDDQQEG